MKKFVVWKIKYTVFLAIFLVVVFGVFVLVFADILVPSYVDLDRVYSYNPRGMLTGYEVQRNSIEAEHYRQLDRLLRRNRVLLRGNIERDTLTWTATTQDVSKRANGQTSCGTRFTTEGSGFLWSNSGRAVTVNLPLSDSAHVRASFVAGRIGGDFFTPINSSQVGRFVHLYVTRDYEIRVWTTSCDEQNSHTDTRNLIEFITVVPISLELSTQQSDC